MSWSDRQRQMLAAMGLKLWLPENAAPSVAAPPAPSAPSAPQTPRSPPAAPAVPVAFMAKVAEPLVSMDLGRAQAVAQMGWAELAEAAAGCKACGLCDSRKQAVFGVGAHQASWMVVGEAPGEQEDLQGEPFVGPAGQLLDQMLAAVRRSREATEPAEAVYIANTLKCRPPRNRNPTAEELQRCAPLLARQIELVRPRLILAMGRFAIQHLLGTDEAVGRLRGKVHQHAGIPVVVTYHPAYLLRQLPDKRKAWDDLCLALEVSQRAMA